MDHGGKSIFRFLKCYPSNMLRRGDYIFSFEPEAGTGYVAYIDTLTKYV